MPVRSSVTPGPSSNPSRSRSRRARGTTSHRRASARPPTVPLPLYAFGVLLDGTASGVHGQLAAALADADTLLQRAVTVERSEAHEENAALEMLFERAQRSASFGKLTAIGPDAENPAIDLVVETALQGLWTGMALCYRFLQGGAR